MEQQPDLNAMPSIFSLTGWTRRQRHLCSPFFQALLLTFFLIVYLLFRETKSKATVSISAPLAVNEASLPTLYDYYSKGGVRSGLQEQGEEFVLNGKKLHILSGSIHYFRVPSEYWRDRLKKLRAAGFNTVMTYAAWNMHEKQPGMFDFGGMLDLPKFIKIAQEEDLLVIVRPGPYICSEFEFGGLPGWLLNDRYMRVRRSYEQYHKKISLYFTQLLSRIKHLQWSAEYGAQPIIAMQVENEYASYMYGLQVDRDHLPFLLNEMKSNGMRHVLYFTSDSVARYGDIGSVEGALMTVNTGGSGDDEFEALDRLQPGRPKMVAEFWAGWFDHWSQPHHTKPLSDFVEFAENILSKNASINLYMFHGGTSFGFYSGANAPQDYNGYIPTVNSYDYDAPLSESGDYTEKYYKVEQLIEKYNGGPKLRKPQHPPLTTKTTYQPVEIKQYLSFEQILNMLPSQQSVDLVGMESLPGSNVYLGFIVYSQSSVELLSPEPTLTIKGPIRDIAYIVVDGELMNKPIIDDSAFLSSGFWGASTSEFKLKKASGTHSLHIIVEAMGRVNFGKPDDFDQRKGLPEAQAYLDEKLLNNWKITPLGFDENWIKGLKDWKDMVSSQTGPCLFRGSFYIDHAPKDTWLDMRTWIKGVVFINGFNLGRYWNIGPTQTMFLPAPLLLQGLNEIAVFEIYQPGKEISFRDAPIL